MFASIGKEILLHSSKFCICKCRFSWASDYLRPQRLRMDKDILHAMLIILNWYKSGRDINTETMSRTAMLDKELRQELKKIVQFGNSQEEPVNSNSQSSAQDIAIEKDKLQYKLVQDIRTCTWAEPESSKKMKFNYF